MSKVLITRSKLDNLANTISSKSGEPLPLTLDQMDAAVDSISGGDVDVEALSVTSNGTYTAPSGTAYSPVTVAVEAPAPSLQSKTKSYTPIETAQSETVTADSGYDGLSSVAVSVGAISSTYVGSGITQRSSSDLTASGATVTVPSGYYSSQASKAVSSGAATAPATISGTSATVSTGTNTLTLSKTVSVTPTVSAGYVSSGTAGNSSVSLTANVTTQAAQTIYPSASDQSIASGRYLTGAQTIKGVTTSNLTADNIKSGVTVTVGDSADADRILSVTGTYSGGGSVNVATTTWTNNSSTATSHQFTGLSGTPKAAFLRCTTSLSRSSSSTNYFIADMAWNGTSCVGNSFRRSNGTYANVTSGYTVTTGTDSITFTSNGTSTTNPGSFYNGTYELVYVY